MCYNILRVGMVIKSYDYNPVLSSTESFLIGKIVKIFNNSSGNRSCYVEVLKDSSEYFDREYTHVDLYWPSEFPERITVLPSCI